MNPKLRNLAAVDSGCPTDANDMSDSFPTFHCGAAAMFDRLWLISVCLGQVAEISEPASKSIATTQTP